MMSHWYQLSSVDSNDFSARQPASADNNEFSEIQDIFSRQHWLLNDNLYLHYTIMTSQGYQSSSVDDKDY